MNYIQYSDKKTGDWGWRVHLDEPRIEVNTELLIFMKLSMGLEPEVACEMIGEILASQYEGWVEKGEE